MTRSDPTSPGARGALTTRRLTPDPECDQQIVVDVLPGYAPTLVFLHGMTSTRVGSKSDALLARAASRGQGFARPDFRGHGESDGDLPTLRFSQLVEDTRAVIAAVGPSILVGSSMGGLAAAWTAARHPEGIQALVLLSPALGFLKEMARHSGGYDLRRSDEQTVRLSDETLRDAERFDESKLPIQLQLPVMLVHGSDDTTVPLERSRDLCTAIPHTDKELWIIDGGSHSLHEVTEPIFDRMEAFLRQRGIIPAAPGS